MWSVLDRLIEQRVLNNNKDVIFRTINLAQSTYAVKVIFENGAFTDKLIEVLK